MANISSSLDTSPSSASQSGLSQQERKDAYSLLIGHVRDIGQEAQYLRKYQEELRGKVSENHAEVFAAVSSTRMDALKEQLAPSAQVNS